MVNLMFHSSFRESFDSIVELKLFSDSEVFEQSTELRTVTDVNLDFLELFLDVVAVQIYFSTGRKDISCQHLKSSRFAGAIDSKKAKNLSFLYY